MASEQFVFSTPYRRAFPGIVTFVMSGLRALMTSASGGWRKAKGEGFTILTKDNDFLARALVRGHPPQVVQVCLGNASTRQISNLLQARFDDIERFVMESNESVFMLRK